MSDSDRITLDEARARRSERAQHRSRAQHGNGHDASGDKLILDPRAPLASARAFLERRYRHPQGRTLHYHSGAFCTWKGTHYEIADDAGAAIRAELYPFLDGAMRPGKKPTRFLPNRARVGDVLDALRATAHLSRDVRPPAWLGDATDLPATEIIAVSNGLLHLPTLELLSHTPEFFTVNALPFPFDRDASPPQRWLRFLDDLWPNDAEAIRTLQEIFGYLLGSDTRQQKIFAIIGPKRSGKGTIARVLTGLLGQDNVAGPTLAGLAGNFGLAPLIGKTLAIISDARLGAKADQAGIAERLLAISGEDSQTVDRKHQTAWNGKLAVRFLILSNELPRIADASGALASRFVMLTLRESFYGREDAHLTDALLAGLPGILNWSIEGWQRLLERGHFVTPASSAEAMQALEDLASPIGAFLREKCIVDPARTVEVNLLFEAWQAWCKSQGRDHAGTVQTFGRDLRAVVPWVTIVQLRLTDEWGLTTRPRHYKGLGLQ